MAYLRIGEARAFGQSAERVWTKSANQILREEARGVTAYDSFHVFLSHSYDDAQVILGVKRIMEANPAQADAAITIALLRTFTKYTRLALDAMGTRLLRRL